VINWHKQNLTGSIPSEIGNLRSLTNLRLSNNDLSGSIPNSIWNNLLKLRVLYLSSNRLNGTIPSTIGNLVELDVLTLANNQISGTIPSTIGNLKWLALINFNYLQLTGIIPSEIGKLTNLRQLAFSQNGLSGPIPPGIGKLPYLQNLGLGNLTVYGTYTGQCFTTVNVLNTPNVVICGCASAISPAAVFPPPETPKECLASGSATSMRKRTLSPGSDNFSWDYDFKRYTCHVDAGGNPSQDCFNTMALACHPTYMGTNVDRIKFCKASVDTMFKPQDTTKRAMNTYWQGVRKACGQWIWTDGTVGSVTSASCTSANLALQANAYYIVDGVAIKVPASVTTSINVQLWSNPDLKG